MSCYERGLLFSHSWRVILWLLRPWTHESLQAKALFSTCCAHLFHIAALSLAGGESYHQSRAWSPPKELTKHEKCSHKTGAAKATATKKASVCASGSCWHSH